MFKTNNIISEIKSMYGEHLGKGYFECTIEEPNNLTIDICDILDGLAPYEIDNDDLFLDDDVLYGLEKNDMIEEIQANNSYNWLAPVSNCFNYVIYKTLNDSVIIDFKVHCGYTDVRCGYLDDIYYKFNCIDEFYECLYECNKYFTVKFNDVKYDCCINIFNDCIEITDEDGYEIEHDEAEKIVEYIENNNDVIAY